MKRDLRIVFMGTPEFAIPSLDILLKNNYDVRGVITAPDKPAGRGRDLSLSPVKKFALNNRLKILQPENLKDDSFISELKSLRANLFIVVAFRMLPEIVWKMPELGCFNLHASLLPQYRGAAPINRAIMNGETVTGLTTFFLAREIDTGKIICQEKINIGNEETAGELHDRMKLAGATLVLKTAKLIEENQVTTTDQQGLVMDPKALKSAPKIFPSDCRIDWSLTGIKIFNHIRGLSPYPAASTILVSLAGDEFPVKIYRSSFEKVNEIKSFPEIVTDGKNFLKIQVRDGMIDITELQLAGKKKMDAAAFLRGFHLDNSWKIR